MATFNLAPGGTADFLNNFRAGGWTPNTPGINPLKPAGHQSRGDAFLNMELDFSVPNRSVDVLRRASPVIAIADVLNVIVIPQRALWLGTCIAIDVPIPGFAFDIRVADDPSTGPVLDYANTANGLTTNLNDLDGVTTDNAPGVDGTGSALTVASAYSAGTVGFTQYATPIANQAINEQAYLQLVVTAVPSSPLLSATVKGKICIGATVFMSMFPTID